ncbi:MAG: CheB methylesterase domain-containing protein, partial [Halobacteriales archaeon]|nr:CheB methylesterase domain-containing protein [Halobacteriales archaeon]
PDHSCRPAVDPLFRSAVSAYGDRCVALVLSGMGSDGLAGARDVRDGGGQVIVQDEASSVVWGMPGFIAREGLADAVLPLEQIAEDLTQRARALAGSGRGRKAMTT